MRFDVVHLIAQFLKTHEVMDRLPGNTGDREVAQKSQQHNFVWTANVHAGWREDVFPGWDFLDFKPIWAQYNCSYNPPNRSSSS